MFAKLQTKGHLMNQSTFTETHKAIHTHKTHTHPDLFPSFVAECNATSLELPLEFHFRKLPKPPGHSHRSMPVRKL